MRARRTPWWSFVLAAALGVLAGMGLSKYGEISGLPLVGAPWIVPVVLAVLGGVVLYMALHIHNTRPKIPSNARSSSHWTRRRRSARWWPAKRSDLRARRWPAGTVGRSS